MRCKEASSPTTWYYCSLIDVVHICRAYDRLEKVEEV